MTKDVKVKHKILFYDIETTPLLAYIWRPGKQFVGHKQLHKDVNMHNIICITYCWNDGKKAKALVWDHETKDCSKIVAEFDELVKQADITIGKNSDRFDVKHINTQRMLHNLQPFPEWSDTKDDLEKQMRKYFALPSQSLDYISAQLGYGGKIRMEFQDWIDIMEDTKGRGKKALKKMVKYGLKDIVDTRAVWSRLEKYFKPRFNMATHLGDVVCVHCGSKNIYESYVRVAGKSKYQIYRCKDHGGYAGCRTINKYDEPSGKMGS